MVERCIACPLRELDASLSCPGVWDWPGYCGHAANRSRYWIEEIRRKVHLPPIPVPLPPGTILFRAHCNGHTGYGLHAIAQGMELEKIGHPVRIECIDEDNNFLPIPDWTKKRVVAKTSDRPAFQTSTPFFPHPPGDVAYTMWESTRLSQEQVDNLNACRAVLVPCEAVRDWFVASGVTPPIRIVPLGIDPEIFHPRSRTHRETTIRFGCAGRTAHGGIRKGIDEVILSFLEAFPADPRVRLDVKVWPDCSIYAPTDDPRITIVRDPKSFEELADWFRSLDVFCSASRGEGFGFMPLQAMACGVPTLAPVWGGHTSYMTPETGWAVNYREEPAEGPIYGGKGNWCVTRRESMVSLMREAASDHRSRLAKGELAAIRALDFTWEKAGRLLESALIEFGLIGAPRPIGFPSYAHPPAPYRPAIDPAIRDAVNACPDRGSVLPISMQADCGCQGKEVSECRAGKGTIPGRVTLRDCLMCCDSQLHRV